MKADLTRNSFREASAYTSVRLLAGRPLLDADWNEAMEIIGRRAARTLRDVVGRVGTPVSDNGFRIDVDGEGVTTVRAGSYLVDGMRCINDADQVVAMPSGVPDGEYQVYLEAWQVLVTALEDPTIREPALLGPDHGARTKVMWRVALEAVGDQPQCAANDPAWTPQGRPHSDARLRAQAQPPTTGNDPCIVPSAAGYRSLDNQLFRVQVHHVEDLGDQTARVTWKWARDNASTAVRWTNPSITIDAPDVARLTGEFEGLQEITSLLSPGDLLELGTDSLEWDDVPGYLVRLVSVSEAELVVSSAIDPTTVGAVVLEALDVSGFTKIRRWDDVDQHELPSTEPDDRSAGRTTDWQTLQGSGGVQIDLGPGIHNVGDHWMIPARTSTGDVMWPPPSLTDDPEWAQAEGTTRHYAALAVVERSADSWQWEHDCRRTFLPLVDHADAGGCHERIESGATLAVRLAAVGPGESIHVCLTEGDHVLEETIVVTGAARVVIEGAGQGSRILAPAGEGALIFNGCAEVRLVDVVVESPAPPPEEVDGEMTLTLIDCLDASLERTTLRCGTGLAGTRACLDVRSASSPTGGPQPLVATTLRDCALEVGDRQHGIIARDVHTLTVEHCRIEPDLDAEVWSLTERIGLDSDFLDAVRLQLLRMVTEAGAGAEVLETDPWLLLNSGHDTAAELWGEIVDRNASELNGETVEQQRQQMADWILGGEGGYDDVETEDGPLFTLWHQHRFSVEGSTRIVDTGIRVEGLEPDRLLIRDNRVVDAMRPVVIALAGSPSLPTGFRHRTLNIPPAQGQSRASNDQARTVTLEHNTLEMWLGADGTSNDYSGVRVGAVQQLTMRANRLEIRRSALADADIGDSRRWPAEAVFVDRPIGPMVLVADNVAVASDLAAGRVDFDVGLLWLEVEGAATTDLVNQAQPLVAELSNGLRVIDHNLWSCVVAMRVDTELLP